MNIFHITSSATKSFSTLHFLINQAMSPFSQYSITMYSFLDSLSIILSKYFTILGWDNLFKALTSDTSCCFSLSYILPYSISFQHKIFQSALRFILNTDPKLPFPISSIRSYLSILNYNKWNLKVLLHYKTELNQDPLKQSKVLN